MTNELLAHIRNLNAKSAAWVAEDPEHRMAGSLVEEAEHWNSIGITTVEQFEHYNLVCTTYELTRSAFGYKPSWEGLNGMTDKDLQKEIDFLGEQCKRQLESEQQEEIDHNTAVENAMTVHSGWSIGELIKG